MIRALAFLIIAIIAVAAVLASNHEKQLASAPLVKASIFHKPGYRFAPCPVWIGPRPQGKVNQA